jgi:glycosyltransferase involved in cell wall biosynthesis
MHLRIMCTVPRGIEGKGGIERLFRYVREAGAPFDTVYVSTRGDGGLWRSLMLVPLAAGRLLVAHASGRLSALHLNVSSQGSAFRKITFFAVARAAGVPIVLHYHARKFDARDPVPPLWVRAIRYMARRADAVIVLGQSYHDLFIELGTPADRLFVVHNGVPDFAGPRPPARPPAVARLLFAGAVGERKGVDLLVEALTALANRQDWTCQIAGDGDAAPYQQAVMAAGLADRVKFLGWVSSERIQALLQESDVVLLPSRAEALPVSLIEGAAAGCALVCTDVGSTREIVDDTCGAIVEPTSQSLATALARLLDDRPLLTRMGEGARARYLERFAIDRMISAYNDIYLRVQKFNSKASVRKSA